MLKCFFFILLFGIICPSMSSNLSIYAGVERVTEGACGVRRKRPNKVARE